MRPALLTTAVPAALIAIALGGCGLTDPYHSSTARTTTTAPVATTSAPADWRDPAPERGGTIPTQSSG